MRLHVRESRPGARSPGARDPGAGAGEEAAVVFLHGFPFDGSMWMPQLTSLPAGWRGLAPDLRGFGESELDNRPGEVSTGKRAGGKVALDSEPVLTMARLADDVAGLIEEAAGGRAVVCGLSMGGYVALELWRRHPELVRGLILADTRASADDDEARENRMRMAQTARTSGLRPIATAMLPSLLSERTLEAESAPVEHVREMILRTPVPTLIAALAGMAARHDMTSELPRITVPTLVLVGEHDAITPVDGARRMAAEIPDASCVEIPDAGHLSNMENPDAFNRAMATFLAR